MIHKKIDPISEIHWYRSKEAFMLTYKHTLQPVRGVQFWNVNPSQAMEPTKLVKLAGRPRLKRNREKYEALNRQGEWKMSKKGRVMTCSSCGEPNHNVRGCNKSKKGKLSSKGKGKQQAKEKQPARGKKRQTRGLVDEESDNSQVEEEINLTPPNQPKIVSPCLVNSASLLMLLPAHFMLLPALFLILSTLLLRKKMKSLFQGPKLFLSILVDFNGGKKHKNQLGEEQYASEVTTKLLVSQQIFQSHQEA